MTARKTAAKRSELSGEATGDASPHTAGVCTVAGCDRAATTRGLCDPHHTAAAAKTGRRG